MVITKQGRATVVVLAVQDLEALGALGALEDALDLSSDPNAMADLREAAAARQAGQTIALAKERALEPWTRG